MPSAPANYNLCTPVKLGPAVSLDTLAKYAGTETLFYLKVNQTLEHKLQKVIIKSINQNTSKMSIIIKEVEKEIGCGNFVPILDQRVAVILIDYFTFHFVDENSMRLDGGRRSRKHRKSHRKHRKSHRKHRSSKHRSAK
jgi:hypothetical protein